MNEKLSAFVDNELSELEERRLLTQLRSDEELRSTWGRYHVIRATLRNELGNIAPKRVADSVAGTVAGEPPARGWRRTIMGMGRAAAGVAIAASVAVIAILNLPASTTSSGSAPSLAQNGNPGTIVPVRDSALANTARTTGAEALNLYLVEHSEFAPTAGVDNMLPYVRTISHDNNR